MDAPCRPHYELTDSRDEEAERGARLESKEKLRKFPEGWENKEDEVPPEPPTTTRYEGSE